jgi:hypothetical protein
MRPLYWLAAMTGTMACAGLAMWGCGGDDSKPVTMADASTPPDSGSGNPDGATDASTDAAPCPDADLLAPVDPATDPVAANCQDCIKGNPTCLGAFQGCNTDCLCKNAVVGIAACLASGSSAGTCVLPYLNVTALAADPYFTTLLSCQAGTCATACNTPAPPRDAGADAADGGGSKDGGDSGTPDAGDAGTPDSGTTDAAPADAADDGG